MTNEKRAGASRPSRRLVLNTLALITVGAALLLTIGRSAAENEHGSLNTEDAYDFKRSDAENATELLQAVNGANPVLCAGIDRAFSNGYWGGSSMLFDDQLSEGDHETVRFLGKHKLDRDVLPIVRRALTSEDACTRRIGARLAGNIQIARLDEALHDELASATPLTRLTALIALGYAEQPESLPRFVNLLERDPDPEIRRVAAWALGQLDEQ
jgi:hypothetical protein